MGSHNLSPEGHMFEDPIHLLDRSGFVEENKLIVLSLC